MKNKDEIYKNYNNFLVSINEKLLTLYDKDKDGDIEDNLENVKSLQNKFESEKLQLEVDEKKQIIELRREWSGYFKIIMFTILGFEILLTIFVGFGWFKFEDEWFIRIIVTGGFAQILLMPFILTQFLFNSNSKLSKGSC